MAFARITVSADQMGGVPCVRGLRIPVATVVGMVAEGMTDDEILAAYPTSAIRLGRSLALPQCSACVSQAKLHDRTRSFSTPASRARTVRPDRT